MVERPTLLEKDKSDISEQFMQELEVLNDQHDRYGGGHEATIEKLFQRASEAEHESIVATVVTSVIDEMRNSDPMHMEGVRDWMPEIHQRTKSSVRTYRELGALALGQNPEELVLLYHDSTGDIWRTNDGRFVEQYLISPQGLEFADYPKDLDNHCFSAGIDIGVSVGAATRFSGGKFGDFIRGQNRQAQERYGYGRFQGITIPLYALGSGVLVAGRGLYGVPQFTFTSPDILDLADRLIEDELVSHIGGERTLSPVYSLYCTAKFLGHTITKDIYELAEDKGLLRYWERNIREDFGSTIAANLRHALRSEHDIEGLGYSETLQYCGPAGELNWGLKVNPQDILREAKIHAARLKIDPEHHEMLPKFIELFLGKSR